MYTKLWLDDTVNDNGTKVSVERIKPEGVTGAGSGLMEHAVWELTHAKSLRQLTVLLRFTGDPALSEEGFRLRKEDTAYIVEANTETGLLYGAFRFVNLYRLGFCECTEVPANKLRMLNHWDNMDGSIERGYSGNSFFFKDNEILINERTRDYARLLASLGINGLVINNVNVRGEACNLINDKYIAQINALSELFSSYGVKLFLSLNFAAPVSDENVGSCDPLDMQVYKWWARKFDEVYKKVPHLGGFLVKADSEGRPGPFTYGRNQAEGANMLARAIRGHGGIIIWRCFVYNCQQDWRDLKTDRARAAYDYFHGLDGCFDENVVLQIKNGPMDFQVREPVSPLFGQMPGTNQMIEFQIAQEYTGQQRHVCYLIPWFKEILSFKTYACGCKAEESTVSDVVSGKAFGNTLSGMCAVTNTGDDLNWTGHDLAAANLYGFGRLSFDPRLSSEEIAEEWIRLTFGNDDLVVRNLEKILMMSWPAYEKYTSPLGIGWMVTPGVHYGPDPDGYEYSRWGTYHKATAREIGVERNSSGTGFAGLYLEPNASMYEHPETTPDELLLFFHRIPYNYVLKSGKTVIQHIYDAHFEGAEDVEEMASLFRELRGRMDSAAFERIEKRFEHQLEHSKEWRDVINSYFYRKTLIDDAEGRTLY